MYVPEAITKPTNGPGSILIAGVALISAIVAGVALGLVGAVVVVVAIFLLLVAEVYREAGSLKDRNDELSDELASAQGESSVIPALRAERDQLKAALMALEEENQRPRFRPEEILEVIGIHIQIIDVVQKHRHMASQVADMPVTRAELAEDGILLTGTCMSGADILSGESLTVVDKTGTVWGDSAETIGTGTQIRSNFQSEDLPSDLVAEVAERNSLNPSGYVLRLSGLHMSHYVSLKDEELRQMRGALVNASKALTRALSPGPDLELTGVGEPVEDNDATLSEEDEGHS